MMVSTSDQIHLRISVLFLYSDSVSSWTVIECNDMRFEFTALVGLPRRNRQTENEIKRKESNEMHVKNILFWWNKGEKSTRKNESFEFTIDAHKWISVWNEFNWKIYCLISFILHKAKFFFVIFGYSFSLRIRRHCEIDRMTLTNFYLLFSAFLLFIFSHNQHLF